MQVTFRGSNTDLTDILAEDILPCDYGGSGKSLNEYFGKSLITYNIIIIQMCKCDKEVKFDISA